MDEGPAVLRVVLARQSIPVSESFIYVTSRYLSLLLPSSPSIRSRTLPCLEDESRPRKFRGVRIDIYNCYVCVY